MAGDRPELRRVRHPAPRRTLSPISDQRRLHEGVSGYVVQTRQMRPASRQAQTHAQELLRAAAQLERLGDEDWFIVRVAAYLQDLAEALLGVQPASPDLI